MSSIKCLHISLTRDLCGKTLHLEAKKGCRNDVDGFFGKFGELVHGALATVEV